MTINWCKFISYHVNFSTHFSRDDLWTGSILCSFIMCTINKYVMVILL